jgi:hypothetical protein
MTWTAPPVFVSGTALTAAQLNILSSDLNETAPAKATGVGQYFTATGVNSIAARSAGVSTVATTETTASTSPVDLTTLGPAATITCGSGAYCMVLLNALVQNNTSGAISSVGFDISGATTLAAGSAYLSITTSAANQNVTMGGCRTVIGMTGGSNTFTMKYFVGSGTGTFARRHMTVLPFG